MNGGRRNDAPSADKGAKAARQIEAGENRVASGGDRPVRRHDDRPKPAGDLNHPSHHRSSLDFVCVEDLLGSLPVEDGGKLPRQIGRILHASVHPLPRERRHEVGGVAGEENAPNAPSVRDASMEGVDSLALDFEGVDAGFFLDERPNRLVAAQLLLALARQLHEFPTHAIADRGELDRRAARIAPESDSLDAVIWDNRIDDEPALRIGRADEFHAEAFANAAGPSVASDNISRSHPAISARRGNR